MLKNLVMAALLFTPLVCFAEEPPMQGWMFGETGVTLNGKTFLRGQYAESWREQDGYALVSGDRLHYWLYDTTAYHGGKADEIYNRVIPHWVEQMGYVIEFDDITVYDPNAGLATAVRSLMTQRGCDISVALVTGNPDYDYVVINEWFKSKGTYKTTVYPLYKEIAQDWELFWPPGFKGAVKGTIHFGAGRDWQFVGFNNEKDLWDVCHAAWAIGPIGGLESINPDPKVDSAIVRWMSQKNVRYAVTYLGNSNNPDKFWVTRANGNGTYATLYYSEFGR